MIRALSIIAALSTAVATPVLAQAAKADDCGLQSDVVAAVQAARVANVAQDEVAEHIAGSNPAWPEKYNAVIPLVTPWIYEMDMSEVNTTDLKAGWNELCLQQ